MPDEKNSRVVLSKTLEKLNQSREQKLTANKSKPKAKDAIVTVSGVEQNDTAPAQMSLDFWPNKVRGVPNALLRGALFSIAQERVIAKKRELVSTAAGIEIRFKGEKWNQTDLDVLEVLLHYARQQPLESNVGFSANEVLLELERGVGGEDHEQLKEELARLMGGVVEITWTKEKKTFAGTLIKNYYRDEEARQYVVIFDKKMLELYEDGYTYIDWEQRRALGKKNLAKWLHGFYASHTDPFPYKVATLKTLCGSTTKRLSDFRKALSAALEDIKKVGAIKNWKIDPETDKLYVIKAVRKKTLSGKAKPVLEKDIDKPAE